MRALHVLCALCLVSSVAGPALAADPNPILNHSSAQLLAAASRANDDLYSNLESFTCTEQMTRYRGDIEDDDSRLIDTITAKLSFENGAEEYTNIRRNNTPLVSIESVHGAWSEGEFGTLLRQTQLLIGVEPVKFVKFTEWKGTPAAVFSMDIPQSDSPWELAVHSGHYRIPFHTEFWISTASAEIVKVERTSTSIPLQLGISEIRWNVSQEPVDLDGKRHLLPKAGEYAVLYLQSHRIDWNKITFADYHRYGSEARLLIP